MVEDSPSKSREDEEKREEGENVTNQTLLPAKDGGSKQSDLDLLSLKVRPSVDEDGTDSLDEDDHQETEYQDVDTTCGIGSFRPLYLRRFANPKSFLVVSSFIGILQGAFFTYFIGVLSTLEKRFSFDSKVSAFILLADNLSPVFTGSCLGYYGGRTNRPRLISIGMMVVVVSCFLSALPYFIYGPAVHLLGSNEGSFGKLCPVNSPFTPTKSTWTCEQKTGSSITFPAVALLFTAYFLNGFGSTAFYTVGTPYIDDNVKKKESPMYFGIMFALRILGPVFGFLLSAVCLKFNEDPFHDPGIAHNDPRFIGAWWIGFIILGILIFIFSLPMLLFPKSLKKRNPNESFSEKKRQAITESVKEFRKVSRRLWRNPVLVCNVMGAVFTLNGILGYFVFMPKYVENQFRFSASDANFVTGATTTTAMVAGMFVGALLIRRFKPSAKRLSFCMMMVGLVSSGGMFVTMFFKCDQIYLPGASPSVEFKLELKNPCNSNCGCTTHVFQPTCGEDDVSTYFSPCFAGCKHYNVTKNGNFYSSCSCIQGRDGFRSSGKVFDGHCPVNCYMFIPFIIIFTFNKFISSSSRIGGTLLTLRCINPEDKDFALGAVTTVISLFAMIPYPIIFGALTDSACIVWESSCGRVGNCWVYDTDKLRYLLHGTATAFLLVGAFFDFAVFLLSGRVKNLYEEDDVDAGNSKDGDKKGKESLQFIDRF